MAVIIDQTLVGNVGRVYDKRTVGKDNRSVIDFSIACTRRTQENGNGDWKDTDTYWMNVTAWGRLADNIESSFKSGDNVFVKGRIEMSKPYTNKEGVERDSQPKMIAEIAGLEISSFPASSNRERRNNSDSSSSSSSSSKPASKTKSASPQNDDDDLDLDF